jgi:4'-phosphopantetheinyl transferase
VRATAGSVDIWRADLATIGGRPERLLDDGELARGARIMSERRRVLWSRSRGFLRALLGCYLDRDPPELRFVLGPHGKPALAQADAAPTRDRGAAGKAARDRASGEDGATADLRFNLSHSGGLALVAVTAGREVGIDLETAPRRVLDEPALAARVLGRAQAARLAELDPRTREREFMRAWVAHEAAVKCRGLGLFAPPPGDSPRLGDSTRPGDPTRPGNSPRPGDSTRPGDPTRPGNSTQADLWTAELDVGPDAYAAVAVEGGPYELRLRDWPGYQGSAPPVSVAWAMFARKAAPVAPVAPGTLGSPGALPPPPSPQM